MKASDKIYVAKTTFPKYVDWDGSPINTKKVSDNDICYIRKDALIEWLLKGIEMSERCGSEYGDACAQAYQAVVDKINSM